MLLHPDDDDDDDDGKKKIIKNTLIELFRKKGRDYTVT